MAVLARQASSNRVVAALGNLAPGLAPVPSGGGEEMFDCAICFMSKPVSDQMAPLGSCEHDDTVVCRECFVGHLKYEIDNGKVKDGVACCVDGCPSRFGEDALAPLVSAETMRKFHKFRANATDATMRECSKCGHNQSGDPDHPIMTCGGCGAKYCYYHATSHEPTDAACREFHVKQRSVERQNLALLDKTAAACPRCKAVTTKSMGCNHMTCRCKAEWCWLCGMDITGNHQWHYTPGNPTGCPSLMMADGDPNSRRDAVMAAIAEQGTLAGRVKNFWRGLLTLARMPFEIAALVIVFAIVYTVFLVLLPCACCALCFALSRRTAESAQGVAFYFGFLVLGPCLLPIAILRVVFTRLFNAVFLVCCCTSPPASLAPRTDGLGPSPGQPRFGARGGEGIETEHRHFDGAAAPKEGSAARAASAAAAAPAAASSPAYGAADSAV